MESSRRGGASRAGGGDYEASPVPAGVVYPEPPIRSQISQSYRQRSRRDAEGDRDRERERERNIDGVNGDGDGGRASRQRGEEREREGEIWGGDLGAAGVGELRSQSPAPLDRPISLFDGE